MRRVQLSKEAQKELEILRALGNKVIEEDIELLRELAKH